MKKERPLYLICILLAGVFWGIIGVFVRAVSAHGFSSAQVTALRLISGTMFLFLFAVFYDRSLFKIRLSDIWLFALIGIFSVLMMSWFYFEAIERTSLSLAGILLYTAPIWVLIASVLFYGERITVKKIISLLLAFAGCVLVSGVGSDKTSVAGILFGLGSGVAYALYSIIGKYVLQKYKPLTATMYSFLFAAIGGFILCGPAATAQQFSAEFDLPFLLLILGFGFVTIFLSFFLYTIGLSKIPAGKAAITASVDPLVATFTGMLVFGEFPPLSGFIGIILILCAVVLLNIGQS